MRVTLKPVFWKWAQDGLDDVALEKEGLRLNREWWTDASEEKSAPIPEECARAF
jgi:hypothetical protein